MAELIIRKYESGDCAQLAELFYQTVHSVNARDYTGEQLDAWATGQVDLSAWDRSFSEHYTAVAVLDGGIVGFGDIDGDGYLDRLYVHREHQRCGIASAICDVLEHEAGGKAVTTDASITAKPFFESRGYHVVRSRLLPRNNRLLSAEKPRCNGKKRDVSLRCLR